MPIPFEEIEAAFVDAVKAYPAFVGWKKKGKRLFWHQAGEFHQGVELMRFKGSFEGLQWVGVCAFISYVHAEKPLGYVSDQTWKNGRVFLRSYIVPERQMVDEPTFKSGAVVKLREREELKRWSSGLSADFSHLLVPWLNHATQSLRAEP
jgi:hypothetical protein